MECDKRTVPLSHLEGSANRGGLEGLAEPGGQLLGVTLQVAVELGRGHAAHLRDLLLVDMQLARLNMGKVDLTPFALAATVAVVLEVHHVSEVLKIGGIARNAELLVDAARRGSRDVFPGERMAGAAIGQHPAPQALERTAATEQQARVFAPALYQKRQKCLMQNTLAGMGLDAVDGAERLAGRGIDRHDLGACAVAPRCANSGEQAYTTIPRGVTVSWAMSANLPSPTAIFVVCIPMGSPVARDVPETIFACIAAIQASAACDKGTASLSHELGAAHVPVLGVMLHALHGRDTPPPSQVDGTRKFGEAHGFNVGITFGTAVGGTVVGSVGIAYVGAVGAAFSLVAWALTLVTIKLARWERRRQSTQPRMQA